MHDKATLIVANTRTDLHAAALCFLQSGLRNTICFAKA
jgi:hypothetical protein